MAKPAKSERREEKPPPLQPLPATGGALVIGDPDRPSLARALTPAILLELPPTRWLFSLPAERRHLLLLAGFCAMIFLPYLGAVGFWDPWEPHYGEVARAMIVREDYIHPYWESAYFFSKPVMSIWLMAVGMLAAGVDNPARGTALYTEWWVRSIYAACATAGVLMVYLAVSRTISRRGAIWAAIILATCPLYFLLARQAMVDMPFVCFVTSAIACLMIAVFEKEYVQDGWLYAFYALAGVATLAKGLLGFVIPGGAMLFYLMFSGDWYLLARLRLLTGALVTLAVAGPWIITMSFFNGKDDESYTFRYRFFIHDHFKRLGWDPTQGGEFGTLIAGVHTTTPVTNFTYFIEQLGYALFPWIGLMPAVIANFFAAPNMTDVRTRKKKARLFVICWVTFTFSVFAFAATKFHHYCFPTLPGLAILMGLYIEKVLEEGVTKYALAWFVGFILFAQVAQNLAMDPKHLTDMFVYNYDRPYPSKETDPLQAFVIIFCIPPVLGLLGVPQIRRWLAAPTGAFLLPAAERLSKAGKVVRSVLARVFGTIAQGFAWLMNLVGIKRPVGEEPEDRLYIVGALTLIAVCFSVYVSAYHWRKLSVHWTQRDLFWEYEEQSLPSEPIAAYQMNWRGETFYSRNLVRQLKEVPELRDYIAVPGRQWLLVEEGRLQGMKGAIGSGYNVRVVDKTNNKFALVVVNKVGQEDPVVPTR